MKTFAERLNAAMASAGLSQAQLADMVGVSQPAIQKMTSGKTTGSRKMVELARALKVRPEWLSSGVGRMRANEGEEPSNFRKSSLKAVEWESIQGKDDEFVTLPLLNISLSAGDGSCELEESSEFSLVFRRYYLRKMGVSENSARLVRVVGQSMEPTLHDGDVVGVNTQDTTIRDGKTYAICQSDLLRVKTLIATPTSVIIRSINREEYPDEVMDRDEFHETVRIIGRVFWSSHSW
ncbi:helix-turn-helix transcriptional regulator [Escherichia albertii]|nr:helix-turn-helix transcriptional regulator [Escherichia albertii]